MAKFTQDVPRSNDPDYLKYSRGWDAGKVDTSAGTLLTNIGENAGLLVGALDQGVKQDIEKAVYEGVDKRRAEQGVDVAVQWQGEAFRPELGVLPEKQLSGPTGGKRDANAPTIKDAPPQVKAYNRSISDLTSAYQQGTISDSFYFSRLESMSRGLRARFPGYRAEVDAMIQNVAGINPANALRRSLLGQMQEAETARKAAAEKAEKWDEKNAQWIAQLYPDKWTNPQKYAGRESEIKANVYALQGREAMLSREKAELELEEKQGKAVEDKALGHAMSTVNTRAVVENVGASNAAQEFQQNVIKKISAGESFTPEEEIQVMQGLNSIKTQRQMWVDNYLRDPNRGVNGKSMVEIIKNQEKLNQIRAEAVRDIDSLITALTNKDMGAFTASERFNRAALDQANTALIKRSPPAALLQAISKNPGMSAVINLIMADANFNSRIVQDVTSLVMGGAITGINGGLTEDMKTLIEAQKSGRLPPKAASSIINNMQQLIVNPQSPVEGRRNAINYLYDNKELQVLNLFGNGKNQDGSTTKATMFSRLANKAITDQIVKDFGVDSPEFQKYDNWVKNQFIALNQVNINTLKDKTEAGPNARYYTLKWDEKGKLFIPDLTPEGVQWFNDLKSGKIPGGNYLVGQGGYAPNWDAMLSEGATALKDFNKSLQTYGSVLDAKKLNTGVELTQILRYNGFDISGQKPEQRNIIQRMFDALVGGDKALATDPTMDRATENYKNKVTPKAPDKRSELNVDETKNYAGVLPDDYRSVLESIVPEESGGNYNRLVFGDGTTPKEANLTGMTVAEVLDYQSGMRGRGHASSAAGKYQIIKGTLQSLVDQGVLAPTDMFDEATQDRAAMALLDRRGYSQWKAGRMPYDQFIAGLKDEWEAVKKFPKTFNRVYATLDKIAKGE